MTTKNEIVKYFNPLDYGFAWTSQDEYTFDQVAAQRAARAARDVEADRLRAAGYTVRCRYTENTMGFCGGEGTGHPEVEKVVVEYSLVAKRSR